jgi:3-phenylpropionate/trans-cinnamate dioxygenase ferredoxin component
MTFQRACGIADVASGAVLAVAVDGTDVAVVRDGDDWYAIDDECSHASIPLSEGDVEGCEIECWLHGSRFDLRSGRPTGLPATQPVPTYPVKIDGDEIYVAVKEL